METVEVSKTNLLQIIDYVKKVYPLKYRYVEETPYYKNFCLIVDKKLICYNNHYYNGDAIRYVAKCPHLTNPVPMVTQGHQVSQDSGETETWQVDSFDVNLAGLWIKEEVNNCEYAIKCNTRVTETNCIEFVVRIHKQYFEYIDMQFINKIMESALDFFKKQYDLGVEIFVKDLMKLYNIEPQRMINFLQRLLNHKDIGDEFIYSFAYLGDMRRGKTIKRMDLRQKYAVKKKGLRAIDLFDKNNENAFETYEEFLDLADEEKSDGE